MMLAAALLAAGLAAPSQAAEVIVEVRVHGNTVMSDDEVRRLAAVEPGTRVEEGTIAAVDERLRASGAFENVEVLKRFASIADASQVLLVIVVDEGPVRIEWDRQSGAPPRTVRRRGPPLMFLPVLDAEDGYGWTYGMRFALPDVAGPRSRVLVPLTWGGDKRAAVQLEKDFPSGPIDRLAGGAALSRRRHPAFDADDDRARVWARAERNILPNLRVGASLATEHVSFMDAGDRFVQGGGDIVLDTRTDPMLARNAVYARAAWDRFRFTGGTAIHRTELEGRAYAGLVGQSVLIARALRSAASRPLPSYLKPMLGGMANLRGFRAGTAVGDTLVGGSLELRVPLTSPLSLGKVGVSAFVDAATIYDHGGRLRDQRFERGAGGSVWLAAAFVRLNLAVARGLGGSTRVHFGTSVTF